MNENVQLAALALIELVARQIVDPALTEVHRGELAIILSDVDPVDVALETATILHGVVTCTGFPMAGFLEAKRAGLLSS